jgi:hypothetical protein
VITVSYRKQPLHLVLQTAAFKNQPFNLAVTLTDITTPLQVLLSRHLNYQIADALLFPVSLILIIKISKFVS